MRLWHGIFWDKNQECYVQFTRLRLNGFKSFVDPTDMIIAPGLTGVVGPNGCGKSNLLEALRWVMGENRASAMRGGGMEDVIFAGAATRPARNFAEVVLHIDNSDRLAPAGFNDQDTLEVIRRITRDAGSAYKANGKDVRARDVQMLFADASTGAHSPALVRQGQISELINAKPKARRRVLEEAAGISGLYQRRHEAELKLKATENNLTRVDDVLEQLAAQLASLARQARQAARYREIGAGLRRAEGMLLYRRWKEADEAAVAAELELTTLTKQAAAAEGGVRLASKQREEAEAALPPLREEEAIAGAVLQRLVVQRDTLLDQETRARETIDRLTARIDQLTNDSAREATLNKDAAETIEKLEWEAQQLDAAMEGHEDRLTVAQEEARAAASALQDRETSLAEATEDVARLSARHQSTERAKSDAEKAVTRSESELEKARSGVAAAQSALETATAGRQTAETKAQQANATAEAAEAELTAAENARAQAQGAESAARVARAEAEGSASTLRAEEAALARLVDREAGAKDFLLDKLTVTPGYEKALGAALADDLRAPLVAGDGSGWAALPGYETPQTLPDGAQSLADFVTGPVVLDRRLGQIGLVDSAQGGAFQSRLAPGQRLVSLDGDLWRWDGFRANAKDAPSAAALRLQQLNRLSALRRDLAAAAQAAQTARAAHDTASEALKAATARDQAARNARRDADRAVTDAARAQSRAEADQSLAASKLETQTVAVARFEEDAASARAHLRETQAIFAALPDLSAARAQIEDVKLTVEAARVTMLSKRSAHDEVRREGDARIARRQQITKDVSGWRHRLDTAAKRITELDERRIAAEAELKVANAAPEEITAKRDELAGAIGDAELRKKAARETLIKGETTLREADFTLREAEKIASQGREARARAEARVEAARGTAQAAADRIVEELDTTTDALLEQLDADPTKMPSVGTLEADVARLRRQRDALGAVNLRAEEDAREVQTEHDSLIAEKADLEEAIKKLRGGIAGLNKEGRERLLAAFDEVNASFSNLFKHLFGGGEAKLVLVESDDPLEAGLEIMCQPPGKKLSVLSLLSGGEQTLTALALIFAVFLANPAPICVLDEVDAPLDDANVTRFCDMLDEMTRRTKTRFMVITHHAITMSRMNRLFGVTMGEQGVSQLVSVDLQSAEQLVA
jgi:chromosome segregation protein